MKILRIAWWKRTHRVGGLIEYVEDIMAELVKRGHQEIWSEMGRYEREFVEKHYDIKKLNYRLATYNRAHLIGRAIQSALNNPEGAEEID